MSNLTNKQLSGFTLIEVLITLVVVSIGLLGLAGLQINGLRANMSSEVRSKASLIVSDIAERMRANPLAVHNVIAADDNQYANVNSGRQNCNSQPVTFCSNYNAGGATIASDCDPSQMAVFDAWVWSCGMPTATNVEPGGLTNLLLNGSGTVTCNDIDATDTDACSPGSSHVITLNWDVPNPNNTGNAGVASTLTQTYTLVMVP